MAKRLHAKKEDTKERKDAGMDLSEEELLKSVEEGLAAEESDASDKSNEPSDDKVADVPKEKVTKESLVKDETTMGTKTFQKGKIRVEDRDGKRLDESGMGKENEKLGGTVTKAKGGLYHYEGSLGKFDYDPKQWAIGLKSIENDGVKASIPVLRYLSTDNDGNPFKESIEGNKVKIPDGVTNLDYTFQGIETMESVPVIPKSVKSAHCTFEGCDRLSAFCTDAKKNMSKGEMFGEKTSFGAILGGGVGAVVGGIAGGVTGGVAGATAGGVGAIPGAIAGIGAGGLKGAAAGAGIGGSFGAGANKLSTKGKGGQAAIPEGLEDATGMFANTGMTESYDESGSNLRCARGMYHNTKFMGTDDYANEHGAVAVTNCKDSGLSPEALQGMYTGTNAEITEQLKGNYSQYWDEETQTYNKPGASETEKKEIEDLNRLLKAEDVKNGVVETQMAKDTDGLAYSAKVRTKTGWEDTQDIHAKNVKSDRENMLGSVGSFLDRAAVSLGEYKIIQLITGSRLIGAIGTFGLQAVGFLPKSMKPVVDAAAKIFGEDSAVGKGLSAFSKMLGDGKSSDTGKMESLKSVSSSASGSDLSDEVSSDMKDPSQVALSDKSTDIRKQMETEGKNIVKNGALLAAAGKDSSYDEFAQVEAMMGTVGAGFVDRVESMADDKGKLSDFQKKELSGQVMNLMNGLSAYDSSACSEISNLYKNDKAKADSAKLGLSKVMCSSAAPIFMSVKELDEKYGFLTKDAKRQLSGMKLSGMPGYDDYQPGEDVFPKESRQESVQAEADPFDPDAGYGEDEAMFGDAYLDDGDVSADGTSVKAEPALSSTGVRTEASVGKKKAKPDRGKLAEEMAARVGGMSGVSVQSEDEFE